MITKQEFLAELILINKSLNDPRHVKTRNDEYLLIANSIKISGTEVKIHDRKINVCCTLNETEQFRVLLRKVFSSKIIQFSLNAYMNFLEIYSKDDYELLEFTMTFNG